MQTRAGDWLRGSGNGSEAGVDSRDVCQVILRRVRPVRRGGQVLRQEPRGECDRLPENPIMSHKCMSKMAVKTSKDTHKSAAELGTP